MATRGRETCSETAWGMIYLHMHIIHYLLKDVVDGRESKMRELNVFNCASLFCLAVFRFCQLLCNYLITVLLLKSTIGYDL
jgi:hypothetical protein